MQKDRDSVLLKEMERLALEAGAKAMTVYAGPFAIDAKGDASPVTEADRLGEEIILAGLGAVAPEIPVLAEEAASRGTIPALGHEFFLVDPLDGTKEFITKTGEFTVNIALVRGGEAILGVVYAPAMAKLYAGRKGKGAYLRRVGTGADPERIRARRRPADGLIAVASRSHRGPETDEFLSTLTIADFAAAGSSLKFCLIAEGLADVYPRLGRTMEWDTGAGQAVLEAAGGRVMLPDGTAPLGYGKAAAGYRNGAFVAWGG